MGNLIVIRGFYSQQMLVLARKIKGFIDSNYNPEDKINVLDEFYKILLKHSQGKPLDEDGALGEIIEKAVLNAFEGRLEKREALDHLQYQILNLRAHNMVSFSFKRFIEEIITIIEQSPKTARMRKIVG